jgi:hypothetical protein
MGYQARGTGQKDGSSAPARLAAAVEVASGGPPTRQRLTTGTGRLRRCMIASCPGPTIARHAAARTLHTTPITGATASGRWSAAGGDARSASMAARARPARSTASSRSAGAAPTNSPTCAARAPPAMAGSPRAKVAITVAIAAMTIPTASRGHPGYSSLTCGNTTAEVQWRTPHQSHARPDLPPRDAQTSLAGHG